MVSIKKDGDNFVFDIDGAHKLWALKSSLTVPAEHIDKAYLNNEGLHIKLGLRFPGTGVPGLIEAGTFYGQNGTIFAISLITKKVSLWRLTTNITIK